jgi:hypothetical protein
VLAQSDAVATRDQAPFGDSAVGQLAAAQTRIGSVPTDAIISALPNSDADADDPAASGSIITGATGVSEQDLAPDTGISEDLDQFIESAGETPVEEGGRPPSAERFPEQVVEGTASAASALINPEFFGRQIERTAEVADPDTVDEIVDDPDTAAETATSELGVAAVEAGEQFARDPGTPVGGAAFTALSAGAGSAAAGRGIVTGSTLRDAVTAELDPRIGPFGQTLETSAVRRLRGDGGEGRPDGGQIIDEPAGDGSGSGSGRGGSGIDPGDDDSQPVASTSPIPDSARQEQIEFELFRREQQSDTPADRQRQADPGSFRDETRSVSRPDPDTVSRRETTTVDDSVDTSRSGPSTQERQAAASRRTSTFDDDLDLSPRQRQLAAQEERPDIDFREQPQVRFDDELSPIQDAQARQDARRGGVVGGGVGAGAALLQDAQQRREQAQAVLPGLQDATGVSDGLGVGVGSDVFGDADTGIDSDIDTGIDSETDAGIDTRIDADTRIDSQSDVGQDLFGDTDIRQDPDSRDADPIDPQREDPDIQDPDPRDPTPRDPEFNDPDLRDPDIPTENDDEDEEDELFAIGGIGDETFDSGIEDAAEVLGTDLNR